MKTFSLFLVSLVLLAGCGSAEDLAMQIPGLPNQDDIQDQVAKDLAAQGIAMPDLTQDTGPVSAGKALVLRAEAKDTGLVDPTVKELWPQVKEYAVAAFPGATLIGFNNFGPTVDDNYTIPGREFANGHSNYWVYIFVHEAADTADSQVDDKSEAFGVEFKSGKLSLVSVEISRGEVNTKDLFGDGLVATDSSVLVQNAAAAVKKEFGVDKFVHASFACSPMWPATFASGNGDCRVTLYESQQTGFRVDVYNNSGVAQKVDQVDFKAF